MKAKKMPYKKTTGKVSKKSMPKGKMSYGKGKKKMAYKKKSMDYK
jgi:hypothetical protein